MASLTKKMLISLLLLFASGFSCAHTIYAANDIPLLDNRFRIDPFSDQVTFILNHTNKPQKVVLVRPDGSKLFYKRHPKSVAWVTGKDQEIITIDKPMAGPWQVIAELNGNNRIKLISKVELKIDKLPLKLYSKEYITTHARLYFDNKLMTNNTYLKDAKLLVSLIGGSSKRFKLYKDDGIGYDALPFDGDLTAHFYIDLLPGRYLLNIRTKNDIFIRNRNKDAIVFLTPINYEINSVEKGGDKVVFTFYVDSDEIDPNSVHIDGVIKDTRNKIIEQLIVHGSKNKLPKNELSITKKLTYDTFKFSAKAFATTLSGREIELQLPEQLFELLAPVIVPTIEKNKIGKPPKTTANKIQNIPQPKQYNVWLIAGIAGGCLLLIGGLIWFLIRYKKKKPKKGSELSLNELSFDELQPSPTELKTEAKTNTDTEKK